MCLYLLPFPRYSRILVEKRCHFVFGAPVKGEAVRFTQRPLVTKKLEWWAYQIVKEFRLYVFELIQRTRVTDGHTDRQNCRGIYANTAARKKGKRKNLRSRMQKKSSLKLYKNYKKNVHYKMILSLIPVYFIKISQAQAGPSGRSQFFSGRA